MYWIEKYFENYFYNYLFVFVRYIANVLQIHTVWQSVYVAVAAMLYYLYCAYNTKPNSIQICMRHGSTECISKNVQFVLSWQMAKYSRMWNASKIITKKKSILNVRQQLWYFWNGCSFRPPLSFVPTIMNSVEPWHIYLLICYRRCK